MSNITLTPDQIVKLIFDKKITLDSHVINVQGGAMEILYFIEDRLVYGKGKSKDPVFCKRDKPADSRHRKQSPDG
jgi:hypothetical protein